MAAPRYLTLVRALSEATDVIWEELNAAGSDEYKGPKAHPVLQEHYRVAVRCKALLARVAAARAEEVK